MAPGCLTIQAKQHDDFTQLNINKDITYITLTSTNSEIPNTSNNLLERPENVSEINLDQIPLPDTPPPAFDDEYYEHETIQESKSAKFQLFDTVDSFEILEQTIMKQKRLARLKNTDLRKKILLKRTFDLVCEIMDQENGFNDDKPESEMMVVSKKADENEEDEEEDEENDDDDDSSSSSSSDSDSDSDSEEESDEDEDDDEETKLKSFLMKYDQSDEQIIPSKLEITSLNLIDTSLLDDQSSTKLNTNTNKTCLNLNETLNSNQTSTVYLNEDCQTGVSYVKCLNEDDLVSLNFASSSNHDLLPISQAYFNSSSYELKSSTQLNQTENNQQISAQVPVLANEAIKAKLTDNSTSLKRKYNETSLFKSKSNMKRRLSNSDDDEDEEDDEYEQDYYNCLEQEVTNDDNLNKHQLISLNLNTSYLYNHDKTALNKKKRAHDSSNDGNHYDEESASCKKIKSNSK